MMKKIILFLTLTLCAWTARAASAGDWKIYPSFDLQVGQVVPTPGKVYFTALQHPYLTDGDRFNTYVDYLANLYEYDIEANELSALTHRDRLSDVRVGKIAYNPDRKYLVVTYRNGNIDILHDDGRVRNIQGLKLLTIIQNKDVNDITFSPENKEIYIATSFGYIVIDDEKAVITGSKVLGSNIKSAGRVGNSLFLVGDTLFYQGSAKDPNLSLRDFKVVDNPSFVKSARLLPLTPSRMGVYVPATGFWTIDVDEATPDELGEVKFAYNSGGSALTGIERVSGGYYYDIDWAVGIFDASGKTTDALVNSHRNAKGSTYASCSADMTTIWDIAGRKGLRQRKVEKDKKEDEWTVLNDYMLPAMPVSGISAGGNIAYNPSYGMLTANHSVTGIFLNNTYMYPNLLSGLKDGHWSVYSPEYTNEYYCNNVFNHPRGPESDPDNPKYVYFGSWYNGMCRLNLDDSDDILHMTHPSDGRAASLPGYRKLLDDNSAYRDLCHFSAPRFDTRGNLWALHNNYVGGDKGYPDDSKGVIWVWPSADRKAGNVDGWVRGGINGFTVDKDAIVCPLKNESNRNYVIVANGRSVIHVIDTKGTPTDFSDDVTVELGNIYDQDGSLVTKNKVYDFYEDPETSNVWVATGEGIFTFNPRTIFSNPTAVRRIKVSRNDGTNLADYLLSGIPVVKIVSDKSGNKWFATSGAGLVQTSADGTHVIRQLMTNNSYLPEDVIYDMGYNPETNSLLLSTKTSYAEYFPPGSSTGKDFDAVKIYPNPVRPDYHGWITIEGLIDNSLIKIVDASGNIVKELGHSVGGVVQWDGTNTANARVNSGVYYVMMSNTDVDASVANVGKVLVVK